MDKLDMILENQRTIQKEIVDTRNQILKTYKDLDVAFTRVFQRMTELENAIKKR